MKIKILCLEENRSSQDFSYQNDILLRTDSTLQLRKEKNFLFFLHIALGLDRFPTLLASRSNCGLEKLTRLRHAGQK